MTAQGTAKTNSHHHLLAALLQWPHNPSPCFWPCLPTVCSQGSNQVILQNLKQSTSLLCSRPSCGSCLIHRKVPNFTMARKGHTQSTASAPTTAALILTLHTFPAHTSCYSWRAPGPSHIRAWALGFSSLRAPCGSRPHLFRISPHTGLP